MPKNHLDIHEERFCELVGLHGYRETNAVRECWPGLVDDRKPYLVYKKVRQLSKSGLVQARIAEWNEKALAEPRRLLKLSHRSSERILLDPDHKNYVGTARHRRLVEARSR